MKFPGWFFILFYLLLDLLPLGSTEYGHEVKTVLFIHSYHKDDWTDSIMAGADSVLSDYQELDFYIEYMDTKHLSTPQYYNILRDLYEEKYYGVNLDAIVLSDNNALGFVMSNRDDLFRDIPVFFCGINNFNARMVIHNPRLTGVAEQTEIKPTLDLARQWYPDAERVYLIVDHTRSGKLNFDDFTAIWNSYPEDDRPNLILLRNYSYKEISHILESASEGDYAYFISFWKDVNGMSVSPSMLEPMFRNSAIPVFGRSEWMVGKGMLGGNCVRGKSQGKAVAELLVEYFQTGLIGEVITESPNQFLFDYNQLKKFGIRLRDLPDDSDIINKPGLSNLRKEVVIVLAAALILSIAFIGFLVTILMIRQKSDQKIQESLQRMHLALQGGNLGLWDWNIKTGRFYFSNRWLTMLGYDPKDVVYSYEFWENLVHPDDLAMVLRILKDHLDGNTVFYEVEHRLKKIDGSWCWVLSRGEVVERDNDGTPRRAIGTHLDVTERILGEKALMAAKQQAEESDRLKSAFLANMSHEIRTPMNGIIGFAELMTEPDISVENAQDFARIILTSGRQLLTIVNDILDISRIETGQVDISFSDFSLNPVLEELYIFFQSQIHFKGLEFSLDNRIDDGNDLINSDREKLIRILTNFVGNAMKFTEKGYVKLGAYALPETIVIFVEDTGPGIPEASREDIFQRFQQVHNTSEQSVSGTGLGLPISQAYADMINARIELESTEGQGSVFRLILPR